ncbi:MAG: hypothetical protein COA57_11480 [Flavobacteriales bacterium]|nr:MAG: hypothetical protein COA57_11480 [Flavobacteriales bacterium]
MKYLYWFVFVSSLSLQAQIVRYPPHLQESETGVFTLRDTVFKIGQKYECSYVRFEQASVFLKKISEFYLDSLADLMAKYPSLKIGVIYRHRNWPENADINFLHNRAKSITEYLYSKGVKKGRIMTKSVSQLQEGTIEEINRMENKGYAVEFWVISP